MRKGFMKQLGDLIYESDIILEILDARFPDKTRNKQVEDNQQSQPDDKAEKTDKIVHNFEQLIQEE